MVGTSTGVMALSALLSTTAPTTPAPRSAEMQSVKQSETRYYNYIDFETRSRSDLKKTGSAAYSEDPTTDVLCLGFLPIGWSPDAQWVYQFVPEASGLCSTILPAIVTDFDWQNSPHGSKLRALETMARDPNCIFVAHNAGSFERRIWRNVMVAKYGFPDIPDHRWKDTMAKCYAHSLPGELKFAAKILNLTYQKDIEGSEAMLVLSKPMTEKLQKLHGCEFWTPELAPEMFRKLYDYCCYDVLIERELDLFLRDLDLPEQEIWEIDQEINDRGFRIDIPTIKKALAIQLLEKKKLQDAFSAATGFNPSQRPSLLAWLHSQGIAVPDTTKDTLRKIIESNYVDSQLANLLRLVGEANKTSLAKISVLMKVANSLGVVRDTMLYHGAHTGRWAGRKFQPQNLPRPKVPSDLVIACIKECEYWFFLSLFPQVNTALSSAIRGFIIPFEGDRFISGDLAQMEKLMLAWLSGNQKILDEFNAGIDGYSATASEVFGRTITKKDNPEERQVGKVTELAAQYGGGIGSFVTMAANYEFDLNLLPPLILPRSTVGERERGYKNYHKWYLPKFRRAKAAKNGAQPIPLEVGVACNILKERWRNKNPATVAYWKRLEDAAIEAVETRKPVYQDGLVWFTWKCFLVCKLHSGRHIYYPFPRVGVVQDEEDDEISEEDFSKPKLTYCRTHPSNKKIWIRVGTYGGKLAENITQAEQREILAEGLRRLRNTVYKVVLHVHDEWVTSVKKGVGSIEEFKRILEAPMACYPGLPIRVDADELVRYRK